jgi:hypothetical protein
MSIARRTFFRAAAGCIPGCLLNARLHHSQPGAERGWVPHSSDLQVRIGDMMRETNVPGLSTAVFKREQIM